MRELGWFFVGAGLLFVLHPSAAARYPDSDPDGQRLVRYVGAPTLVFLGLLISLETTIQ